MCNSKGFKKTGLKGRFTQGADSSYFLGGWLSKRQRQKSCGTTGMSQLPKRMINMKAMMD